jgi:demethylmenaquinone methyltransferase / 2-methoxy-6-polyprenyl-1,4-benzoquinol methylase
LALGEIDKVNSSSDTRNAAEFDTQSDDIFGRISGRYDLLCDLFSFGIHRVWKREVAKIIAQEKWSSLLDTATGTGDIVLRVLNRDSTTRDRFIIASDISPKMLEIAKRRLGANVGQTVQLEVLDAQDLHQIETESVDCYSMSLGLKICDRKSAIQEAIRVLKPGGRIIILEASNISIGWLHKAYLIYMELCMPLIGWIATGGDASAYKYLLQGIKEFPSAESLKLEMESMGLREVDFSRLSLGIVAIHTARK